MKRSLQFLFKTFFFLYAFSIYGQNILKVPRSNSGQTITLDSSQILEVELPSCPSTGYCWFMINTDQDVITQVDKIIKNSCCIVQCTFLFLQNYIIFPNFKSLVGGLQTLVGGGYSPPKPLLWVRACADHLSLRPLSEASTCVGDRLTAYTKLSKSVN